MATRAHIIVKDNKENKEHFVYHHWDGYIEGVGEEIKHFAKSDSYNPTDFSADEFCKQLEEWDESYRYEDLGIHGDEDFIYTVEINTETKTLSFSVEEVEFKEDEDGKWKEWREGIVEYKEDINII